MLHPGSALTLTVVLPIDMIRGAIPEGPWECLGLASEALEFHL